MAQNNYKNYKKNHNNHRDNRNDVAIKSTYNFVPLSDKVFFPDWADKVSMDIPFEDGISGELTIELTADTDIYTRESYPITSENNNKNKTEFFKITEKGEYAIPGTSIKGVVRNVLEIASFSKIIADDKRYAVRDLNNRDLYANRLTIRTQNSFKPKAKAGWLIENDFGEHFIIPCEFARIEQNDINAYAAKKNIKSSIGFKRENAVAKYNYFSSNPNLLKTKFDIGQEIAQPLVYRKATFNPNGKTEGTLVFTGQSQARSNNSWKSKSHPKHLEFVFYDTNENKKIEITSELYKDFCFIHSDTKDSSKPNAEWKYWKKKMQNGERVPVFYMTNSKGQIESMGLAMMYRLAYANSIKDAIEHTSNLHFSAKKDFSETLFGYIKDQDALRGRVAFSTMKEISKLQSNRQNITTVLGSPKPTFYPYYMHQTSGTEKYNTFMDANCKINGWKRYPYQGNASAVPAGQDQDTVATTFKPLPKDTKFEGKIHLHNVKPSELGGLIWALRFGNNVGCHHSVGMAKPYGYGAATIKITGGKLFFNNTLEEKDALPEIERLQQSFVKMMEINIDNWSKSEQILNLLAMAQTYNGTTSLEYPKLGKPNEFVEIKKNHLLLTKHLTTDLKNRLENAAEAYIAPLKNEIEEGKKEKANKEKARLEQEAKELEMKKEQEAKAEEARKAAMTPEERVIEENMPKFIEISKMFDSQSKKPFNIVQCSYFKDIYDICSKMKCNESLELLKKLLNYAETGPKKNKKIKEVKDKIKELFPNEQ